MANILMTWELGSGLGHLAILKPVAEQLAERGHQVSLTIKNFAGVHSMLNGIDVRLLPSPVRSGVIEAQTEFPATYAQLLHNVGFGSYEELAPLVEAWRNLYALSEPDLIIVNHSPTAILAARSMSLPYVVMGTGYDCPPPCENFPDWRPNQKNDPTLLLSAEAHVLKNANRVLETYQAKPLERLSDLFSDVAETILVTYPELDAFGAREGAKYYGIWPEAPGCAPAWPTGTGPKVFAYLRPLNGVRRLLKVLTELGYPTIIRMASTPDILRRTFDAPNLRWEKRFVDIDQTARECDFGICHGTHMMTASMLLAGKPQLLFPPYLEQLLNSENVMRVGAGLAAAISDVNEATLHNMLSNISRDSINSAACRFKDKYQQFGSRDQKLVEAVEVLDCLI